MFDKNQFIGKYCDIQTKDGEWRLGIIEGGKNRESKEILDISLDGWSQKKNQVSIYKFNQRNVVFILIDYNLLDIFLKDIQDRKVIL
jgi:hypothetical protein